jgi:hypothetical protein
VELLTGIEGASSRPVRKIAPQSLEMMMSLADYLTDDPAACHQI